MIKLSTYNIAQFMVRYVLFLLTLKFMALKNAIPTFFSQRSGPSVNDVMPRRCGGIHDINCHNISHS